MSHHRDNYRDYDSYDREYNKDQEYDTYHQEYDTDSGHREYNTTYSALTNNTSIRRTSSSDIGHRSSISPENTRYDNRTKSAANKGEVEIDHIIVYLLTDRCYDTEVKSLIAFFESSSFYQLHIVDIPPPASLKVCNGLTQEQAADIYRYEKVLKEAAKKYPDDYVLVLKDKTVTVTSPNVLENVVRTAVQLAGWRFCYLNRWLDDCSQYTNRVYVKGNEMISLVKTYSPNSTLSILFSPEGRDTIIGKCRMDNGDYLTPINIPLGERLNQEIIANNIGAICAVPNIFEYNIFNATSVSDIAKLSECRRPIVERVDVNPGAIPFIWFLIIVIVVFILLWALYILGPSNRREIGKEFQVQVSER